ncbi:MAG TPA: hypothetical protein VNV62_22625 [Trebonia sp.]|nr:hypothetical protein [Trebonia sp.]
MGRFPSRPIPLCPSRSPGSLRGHATIVYDPHAQTIAVTLTASGLNVGPHAVDISVGYCTDQGPALFKPRDFTADSHGNINAG